MDSNRMRYVTTWMFLITHTLPECLDQSFSFIAFFLFQSCDTHSLATCLARSMLQAAFLCHSSFDYKSFHCLPLSNLCHNCPSQGVAKALLKTGDDL